VNLKSLNRRNRYETPRDFDSQPRFSECFCPPALWRSSHGFLVRRENRRKGRRNAQGNAAAAVKISTVTATVSAIDMATRMVTIVGPEWKKLRCAGGQGSQKPWPGQGGRQGDGRILTKGLSRKSRALAPAPDEVKMSGAAARAPLGERPAGAVGEANLRDGCSSSMSTPSATWFLQGPPWQDAHRQSHETAIQGNAEDPETR